MPVEFHVVRRVAGVLDGRRNVVPCPLDRAEHSGVDDMLIRGVRQQHSESISDILQCAVLQHPGRTGTVVLGEFDGDAVSLLLCEEWNKFRIVVFDPFGGQRVPHHIMRVRAVPRPVHELRAGEAAQPQQFLTVWLRQTLD